MSVVRRDVLDRRVIAVEKKLSAFGSLVVTDEGAATTRRRLSFTLAAPGYGVATEAVFEYRETYHRRGRGWELVRYTYEYRPQPPPSRRAHHRHRPFGVHQHCVDPQRPDAPRHFEGYPYALEQAHDEFGLLYTSGARIRCGELRPLRASAAEDEAKGRSYGDDSMNPAG